MWSLPIPGWLPSPAQTFAVRSFTPVSHGLLHYGYGSLRGEEELCCPISCVQKPPPHHYKLQNFAAFKAFDPENVRWTQECPELHFCNNEEVVQIISSSLFKPRQAYATAIAALCSVRHYRKSCCIALIFGKNTLSFVRHCVRDRCWLSLQARLGQEITCMEVIQITISGSSCL